MKKLILAIIAVYVAMAQTAVAEDIYPPLWRGLPGTTSQVWEFNEPIEPGEPGYWILPDGPAPNGPPPLENTELHWIPGDEPWDHWLPEDMGRFGVVPLSGFLDVVVDNYDTHPENYKLIWLQLTWRPQDVGEEPIFTNLDPVPDMLPALMDEVPLGSGWMASTYSWGFYYNPPSEMFTIGGTINVDELVIDTWCMPEPATIALLGLGALGLIRRKRSV